MWSVNYRFSNSIRDGSFLRDRKDPHELKAVIVPNGIVLPVKRDRSTTYGLGGVLDSEGNYVQASVFQLAFRQEGQIDWGGYYPFSRDSVIYSQKKAIFAGLINNNEWGHFITDWSVRLWYALREDTESTVLFCQRGKAELLPNIRKLLSIIGIRKERLVILAENDEPRSFSEICIPDPSLTPRGYTDEFLLPFELAVKKISGKNPDLPCYKKIYMTRTGLKPVKDFGEKELEIFFSENGFQVLRPEQLELEEQIYYYSHCGEIASLEGSAAHNIVFSDRGIHQIILEKSQAVNVRQLFICQSCEADVDFVGTYPKVKFYDYYSYGPFLVGITTKFQRYVEDEGEYTVPPKKNIGVWTKNYVRYVLTRIGRGMGRLFQKVLRRLNKNRMGGAG